jgi:putative transposase
MTEGLKRYYGEAHLHFITSSCYHQRPYLDASRRDLFIELLEEARQRFQFVVVGYVVMPEHFHLLMSEPGGSDPSWVMKWVKYRVSRRVLGVVAHTSPAHTSRSGSGDGESSATRDVWGTQDTQDRSESQITSERFWQHRFYDFNIFTGHKRAEKLHYMHQNPVKRGLVSSAEDWEWSSARFYSTGEQGVVKVNVGWPEFGMKRMWWR